jgi:integrase
MLRLETVAILAYKEMESKGLIEKIEIESEGIEAVRKAWASRRLYVQYPTWFYKTLRRACKHAEVDFRGVHALRHAFATMALRKHSVKKVAEWLGHNDIYLTYATYGHLVENEAGVDAWE